MVLPVCKKYRVFREKIHIRLLVRFLECNKIEVGQFPVKNKIIEDLKGAQEIKRGYEIVVIVIDKDIVNERICVVLQKFILYLYCIIGPFIDIDGS